MYFYDKNILGEIEYVAFKRTVALSGLDKSIKQTLVSPPSDEWLFGSDLEKRMEAEKQLNLSVMKIKASPAKRATTTMQQNLKNFRSPSRPVRGRRQGGRQVRMNHQTRTPTSLRQTSDYRQPGSRPRKVAFPTRTDRMEQRRR